MAWNILAAALASLIFGYAWYHPRVFGSAWMRFANVTPEMAEKGNRRALVYNLVAFAAALMSAAMLAYLFARLAVDSLAHAIFLATLAWIGFMVPVALGQFLWDHKPFMLFVLNSAFFLISLELMALVVYF